MHKNSTSCKSEWTHFNDVQFRLKSIPIQFQFRPWLFNSVPIQFLPVILDLNSIPIPIPQTLKNAKIRFQFQFRNWNCTSLTHFNVKLHFFLECRSTGSNRRAQINIPTVGHQQTDDLLTLLRERSLIMAWGIGKIRGGNRTFCRRCLLGSMIASALHGILDLNVISKGQN